jgi:tetratricopeptide (TPR) repeat protein
MPPVERATIAHAPLTDHRILRRAEATKRPTAPPGKASPQESPVISFYPDRRDPQDKDVARDLGLALTEFGWEEATPFREQFCRKALPLLETALQAWPEDVAILEAKGYALSQQGRGSEALACFQTALALAPRREWTVVLAAEQADLLGHAEEAIAYWQRAIAVNPWMPEYHAPLAKLLAQGAEWRKALEECEAALRLNPASEETRVLLITCCIHTGGKARARREFETLLALTRQNPGVLRRWFDEQMRSMTNE